MTVGASRPASSPAFFGWTGLDTLGRGEPLWVILAPFEHIDALMWNNGRGGGEKRRSLTWWAVPRLASFMD